MNHDLHVPPEEAHHTPIELPATLASLAKLATQYYRHFGKWPTTHSTPAAFEQAGMPGLCGASINIVLWCASLGISADPDYQALAARMAERGCLRVNIDHLPEHLQPTPSPAPEKPTPAWQAKIIHFFSVCPRVY